MVRHPPTAGGGGGIIGGIPGPPRPTPQLTPSSQTNHATARHHHVLSAHNVTSYPHTQPGGQAGGVPIQPNPAGAVIMRPTGPMPIRPHQQPSE